ncbi:MAG: hypothetical protein QM570_21385 [Planctomycetota bacterium]|nr:hypothetical protein [Planctomycetota bacterium]
MPNQANPPIEQLRADINRLKSSLSRSRAKQVQAKSIIEGSRTVIQEYFNARRAELSQLGLDDESLGGLDALMQELLRLTQRSSLKTRYEQVLKSLNQELNGVEVASLCPQGSGSTSGDLLDGKERRIAHTLDGLVSSAGISYRQACRDLRDTQRLSYRGAAAELREALREALDHLAPDDDVSEQPGFKLEKDQTKPTMKQKMRYILRSRGKNKTVSEAPEKAVEIVEEMVGALARSVYNRSSLSTHVGTTKQEVQQVKAYVDVVLGELLEIA